MRAPLRASLALLAIVLIAAGLDLEVILHAHGDWAQELRAHRLSRVETTERCGPSPHWDRAHSERHDACVACMVSASALGASPGALRAGSAPPPVSVRFAADEPRSAGSRRAPGGGRSPPPAPSPTA